MNRTKLLSIVFIIGLLIPTSISGNINITFFTIGVIVLLFTIMYMLYKQDNISIYALLTVWIFNGILIYFTISSPYSEYSFYAPLYFLLLTLIFCLDFKDIENDLNISLLTMNIVNLISIFFSLSIILEISFINQILLKNYSYFYDELIINMLASNKPVNTFTTHSIAGFYTFIFFLLNIYTYMVLKRKIYLIYSIFFVLFLYYIQSSTSLIYFFCSFIIVIIIFRKSKLTLMALLGALTLYLIINLGELKIFEMIEGKLFSQRTGLKIRYDETGVLNQQIDLIKSDPLKGYGYTSIPGLDYVDSGFVIYALRSSVIGTIILLLGLFHFFKRNLGWTYGVFLLLVFLSFEVGFSNLTYFRSFFIIPFIILYITQLKRFQVDKKIYS